MKRENAMKSSFFIALALVPSITMAAFVIEDDEPVTSVQQAASAVVPAKDQGARPPLIVPSQGKAALVVAREINSATHGLVASRDGSKLLLSFTKAPTTLYVEDPTTGAGISNADWVSDTTVRVDVTGMHQIQIRSQEGTLTVALQGEGLVRVVDERAPA